MAQLWTVDHETGKGNHWKGVGTHRSVTEERVRREWRERKREERENERGRRKKKRRVRWLGVESPGDSLLTSGRVRDLGFRNGRRGRRRKGTLEKDFHFKNEYNS